MLKILNSADIHINLHKKKIPYAWQKNRFELLFNRLLKLEQECDITIIAGDIFDRKPQTDEVALFLAYVNKVTKPTYIIDGNHCATSKGKTFLEHFAQEHVISNSNISIFTKNTNIIVDNLVLQFFPYNEMVRNRLPPYTDNSILITHIRGDIPPHITEEYDFEKLRRWKLILIGDLHVNMKYKDYPAYYPGSPVNVNFDRDDTRFYGVNKIIIKSLDEYEVIPINLGLPKLLRKTIKAGEEMENDVYNHVIYEVIGSIDELAKIEDNTLLDKKIAHRPEESSKLNLSTFETIEEELKAYLNYIKIKNTEEILKEFEDLNVKN